MITTKTFGHTLDIKEIITALIQSPYFPVQETLTDSEINEFLQFLKQNCYFQMLSFSPEDFWGIARQLKKVCSFEQKGFTKQKSTQKPSLEYQIIAQFFQIPINFPFCGSTDSNILADQALLEKFADFYCSQKYDNPQNDTFCSPRKPFIIQKSMK